MYLQNDCSLFWLKRWRRRDHVWRVMMKATRTLSVRISRLLKIGVGARRSQFGQSSKLDADFSARAAFGACEWDVFFADALATA